MFPPFDEEKARRVCLQMIHDLHESSKDSGSAFFNYTGMFGALVALDTKGNEVVLKAFSGSTSKGWNVPGFVPPLFDEAEYNAAISINDRAIHELSEAPSGESPEQKKSRDQKRLALCRETLDRFYALYRFYCADGKVRSFEDIKPDKLLPTGTGDCCAPKLLSHAYQLGLKPVSLAEFYWGKKNTRLEPEKFYPPCDEKCGLILPVILGLEILYRDQHIVVVNKPSGLLSVPGRGEDKQDCVVSRLKLLFPECIEQPSVHRLDMDTSGLMVFALNAEAQRNLSIQFQNGNVQKKYLALVEGIPENPHQNIKKGTLCGRLELKFRLDPECRPYQIYDEENGKLGITIWERLNVSRFKGRTVSTIRFTPLTGRTHQLRLASASCRGLNAPIVGDDLYGNGVGEWNGMTVKRISGPEKEEGFVKDQRLMLHAFSLCFTHPVTGKLMFFENYPDF